jgi:hypothetical protein
MITTSIASDKLVQCVLTLDREGVKSELLCLKRRSVKAEKAKETKNVKKTEKADEDFI